MHNFMRYIRQNRKKIIKVALIAAFLILILQLLNYFAGKETGDNKRSNKSDIYTTSNGTIISDESAVSGGKISTSEIKKVGNKIEEFVKYCNEHNTEEAYNMLSDSCKEEVYPSLDSFISYYYEPLFTNGQRNYSIQNWTGDTYIVKFTEDLLATGKSASDSTYQDYITIEEENGETKLNINKYIGKEELNKTAQKDGIEITVLNRFKYMDYEEYELEITNTTENTILLDQLTETDNIYLTDTNDIRHTSYSNEIVKNDLLIYSKYTKNIKIKFDNPYIKGRKIKNLCFSKVEKNYNPDNNGIFGTTKISIKL